MRAGTSLGWLVVVGLLAGGCTDATSPGVLSGHVSYEDKEYGVAGFTGLTRDQPVRYAVVQALDGHGTVLAETVSDDTGRYHLQAPQRAAAVRLLARTGPDTELNKAVRDPQGNLYAVSRPLSGDGSDDLHVPVTSDAAGAFNILDVLVSAAEFVHARQGGYPPALTAYWEAGNPFGTFYCADAGSGCPAGAGIYVLGGGPDGDTDEYDDDVLWHEYGHFLEDAYARLDNPGGYHHPEENDQDLRMAWSEGWASFFPLAVKTWLAADASRAARLSTPVGLSPAYYIDTMGDGTFMVIDYLDGLDADKHRYASSEAAVAHLLLQLKHAHGPQSVWHAFTGLAGNSHPASLETFWDGWRNAHAADDADLAALQALMAAREVLYREDQAETNDAYTLAVEAAVFAGERLTLYRNDGAADVDYFRFQPAAGARYRIRVGELINGAAPLLRVLDADGVTELQRAPAGAVGCCRRNNATAMAVQLDFQPETEGPYFLEVSSLADDQRPASAGRYGSYRLNIERLD